MCFRSLRRAVLEQSGQHSRTKRTPLVGFHSRRIYWQNLRYSSYYAVGCWMIDVDDGVYWCRLYNHHTNNNNP
jgi:hypothetical protein